MQEKSFGLFCAAGPKEHLAARRNTWQPGAIEWNTRRRRLLVYGSAGHGCFVCPICDESEGPVIVWGGKSASLMKSEEVIP